MNRTLRGGSGAAKRAGRGEVGTCWVAAGNEDGAEGAPNPLQYVALPWSGRAKGQCGGQPPYLLTPPPQTPRWRGRRGNDELRNVVHRRFKATHCGIVSLRVGLRLAVANGGSTVGPCGCACAGSSRR